MSVSAVTDIPSCQMEGDSGELDFTDISLA